MLRPLALRLIAILACAGAGVGFGQYLETEIRVGDTPTDLLWNPATNKVYCANIQDGTVTVISGETNQVVATVPVADYPAVLCLNARENKVYCASCEDGGWVSVICAAGDTLIRKVRMPGSAGSTVLNALMNKLYVQCNDWPIYDVVVIDAGPDTVLKRIRVPSVGDLLWHPVTNRVFVCGDSTKVIDCLTDEIVARLPCRGALWCYNPVNQLVYLASGDAVYVLTPEGDSVVATVPGWAFDMAFVPFANKLYASDNPGIRVIDCDSQTVIDTVPVVGAWLLCDTVKAKVYSTNYSPGVVFVVDARADTVIKSIPLGRYPAELCWNQTNSRVYIADHMDDVVYVIRDTSAGVEERALSERAHAEILTAQPNPFRNSTLVRCLLQASRIASLRIYAQTGVLVRTLAGSGVWLWDGRDDHGRPVPAGVYVLRSTGEAGALLVVKSE